MNTLKNLLSIVAVFTVSLSFGQSEPSYRQNQFNILMLNPAQAGATGYNDISLLSARALGGFTGAPKTINATGNFRVSKDFGAGITVLSHQLGPVNSVQGALNLSYHLELGRKYRLAVGIKGMASSVNIDLPSLSTTRLDDPNMSRELSTGTQFDGGWGLLFYSRKFYVGLSQPRVAKTKFLNADMSDYMSSNSFIGYVGGDFPLNRTLDIRPNVVSRYTEDAPLYLEVNTILTYNKMFDFGLSYQLNSNAGMILGYDINRKLYFGYAYSIPTSALNTVSVQSHELVIRFRINEHLKSRFQGPRFFN